MAPRFDPDFYLAYYPDVAAAGMAALDHYTRYGRAEGRLPYRLRAIVADRDLWLGFADWARPDLERLANDDDPRERGWALWALMRWHAAEAGWDAARRALDVLWADRAARATLRGTGVLVLALATLLESGGAAGRSRVRAMLRLLARRGTPADLALAQMATALKASDGDPAVQIAAHLAPAYAHAGLPAPIFHDLGASMFDRLAAPEIQRANMPSGGRALRWLRDQLETAFPRLSGLAARKPGCVSVIVPAKDAAATLPTALAGLTGQSWRDLEIIVVDDGSTDKTGAVARAWARRDRRIRVLKGRGQGAYVARNLGMAVARGEFLTEVDADDWSHPAKIAEQVRPLMSDPALMATASHLVRVTEGFQPTRWRLEMDEGWTHRNVSSLMIRRTVLDRLGYWDRVRAGGDSEYEARLVTTYGPQAVADVHPGLPLSFASCGAGTLTQNTRFHLRSRIFGPRRDYQDAAVRWHERERSAEAPPNPRPLYLPRLPDRRPFAAPLALCLDDAEAPLTTDDVIRRSALFDARWYLEHNFDVRGDGICAAVHYDRAGADEGRDPGPGFSSTGYQLANQTGDENPLVHWETKGKAAGLAPLPAIFGALSKAPGPRVLVCAHKAGLELFGAERSFLDMLDRLGRPESGVVPVAVLPQIRNADYLDAVRARAAMVHLVPMPWWHIHRPVHPVTLQALQDIIAQHQARTVHVNTAVLQAPRLAGRMAGAEVVVHLREMPAEDGAIRLAILGSNASVEPPPPEAAEWIRDNLLAEADRFVANSPSTARWLDCPDRVTIVGNRIDPGLFNLPFTPEQPLRVALISSNIAKKGVADVVAIAADLAARHVAIRLRLIGPETPDLAALHPLPENVETPGYAASPEAALAGADVVLSLSHFPESFGRTVLEAMAAGRPVICYDSGHPPQLVGSAADAGGIVVPAGDTAAVAEALISLINAPERLTILSNAARRRAREVLAIEA